MDGFAKNVLRFLRELYEADHDDSVRSTEQIAQALNKMPKQLYNHDTDAGPLYRLMRDGYVWRYGDSKRGFSWQAAGAEIVWM